MLTVKHTKKLGFHESVRGTQYIRDIVNYILEKPPEQRPQLTGELYPTVAKKYGKSVSAIEMAIRKAIARCDSDEIKGTSGEVIWELVQRCREGEFDA